MPASVSQVLRDQIRGITGALLVIGIPFHYTMETWWLGWTLPLHYLLGYALVGLALVVLITRHVGFHSEDDQGEQRPRWYVAADFAEILVQSFIASYTMLLLIGIIDIGSSLDQVVRLGLIEIVPLGFGAALANQLFKSHDEEEIEHEGDFPRNLAIFALGSLFVSASIAPTQEMELIAAHMDWPRYFLLIAVTLGLVYLILYEVEFRGHHARVQKEKRFQIGTVFLVYVVGITVSFFLLLGFGHFIGATTALVYQETIVLAFPASIGSAAAEVVI